MNDFFNLDAPLFRFLTRVADMVILSLNRKPAVVYLGHFQHSPLLCSEQVPN